MTFVIKEKSKQEQQIKQICFLSMCSGYKTAPLIEVLSMENILPNRLRVVI